jgi:hypothetical protein
LRILFDQNVPRALASYLTEHEVVRSAELGWEELRNGELLLKAEEAVFDTLITCDQNLEYQQRVIGRRVAIVALSTNNWPIMRVRIKSVVSAVNAVRPGTYIAVDCGRFQPQRRAPLK